MSYLLDTNVVSEWTKPRPDKGVDAFLAQQDEDELFLSVVTLAELRRGVERLSLGRRRTALDHWLRTDLLERFATRVLTIDDKIADKWGRLIAHRERTGRPIGIMDGWIAATAEVHGLVLLTHNTSDFADTVTQMLDPWNTK